MIRAFVAIPLPEGVRLALHALAFQLPVPRRVPPENLHLTLAFLGEQPEPELEELHYRLEDIRADRFSLAIRGAGHFGGTHPRSVHAALLPEPALDRLQARVESAIRQAGIGIEARKFSAHVTLGRFHRDEADAPRLERALVENAGFATAPFEVERFVLYRSHLGHGAPHYEELASYPLL